MRMESLYSVVFASATALPSSNHHPPLPPSLPLTSCVLAAISCVFSCSQLLAFWPHIVLVQVVVCLPVCFA